MEFNGIKNSIKEYDEEQNMFNLYYGLHQYDNIISEDDYKNYMNEPSKYINKDAMKDALESKIKRRSDYMGYLLTDLKKVLPTYYDMDGPINLFIHSSSAII